jgi:hypothetical protein
MIRLFLILFFTSTLALASDMQPIYIWAKQVGEKILNFSYYDNPEYWQQLKPLFSENGWLNFNKSLNKDTINLINEYQLASRVDIDLSSAKLNDMRNNSWHISMPATISYYGLRQATNYPILILMTIDWNNKQINSFTTQVTNKPSYAKLYPRGCNLRKFP